jgi:hypothetical protein
MKKIVALIVAVLFCMNIKAQDTLSIPIYEVSSAGLGEVLDSCISMNCFQRGSGSTGVYSLYVLDTATSVFSIHECYVLQDDILRIHSSLSVYFIVQYRNAIFMVTGRALLKDGVRPTGEKMKVMVRNDQLEPALDDTFFPCSFIVYHIDNKYYFQKYE